MPTEHETIRVELAPSADRGKGAGGKGRDIAVLTLDRPDKLNALNSTVRREVKEALADLAANEGVGAVIVTGAGGEAFAAGADVAEFASRTVAEQEAAMEEGSLFDAAARFPKPILAAVAGYCLGGGCELALACDVRVADPSARFGQPEVRIGLIPGGGGTQRLPRLVGMGHAFRICLSGDFVDAAEAYRIGLVEVLAEEGAHVEEAVALARRMLRWSPVALRLIKESIRMAGEKPLSEGLTRERELFLQAFGSDDGREGVAAFVEKRDPEYEGR